MGIVLSYAFAHIIEAVILWMSMSQMYEHRYKKWVTGLIIMIGHAIMFMVFLSNNMAISMTVNNIVYILLIAVLYKVNKKAAVFWAVLFNSLISLAEVMVLFMTQYIVGIENVKSQNTLIILTVLCLCKILYFLFAQIIVIIKKKSFVKMSESIDISMALLLLILVSSLIVCMTFYSIGMKWNLEKRETIWMIISMIVLVISDILILLVNIKINERNAENQRIKLELAKERADAEYYKLEHEKNEKFEILRHDIKAHLNAMLDMGTDENIKQYILEIIEDYSIGRKTKFSKSNVLNGLLSQYMNKCSDNGINMLVDIRPDTVEYLSQTDIVALFGNMLSNAYEASCKCIATEKPYIELITKRNGSLLIIKTTNSCDIKPEKINNNYVTSKLDDKNSHGYGMKSIYNVVDKYNESHVENYDENSCEFSISIILLIEKEE